MHSTIPCLSDWHLTFKIVYKRAFPHSLLNLCFLVGWFVSFSFLFFFRLFLIQTISPKNCIPLKSNQTHIGIYNSKPTALP